MKRLILFLIRMRLGVKKYEQFQFVEQKSKTTVYFFSDDGIIKFWRNSGKTEKSHVSLDWLLDPHCKIRKFRL